VSRDQRSSSLRSALRNIRISGPPFTVTDLPRSTRTVVTPWIACSIARSNCRCRPMSMAASQLLAKLSAPARPQLGRLRTNLIRRPSHTSEGRRRISNL
jgi:hypothetical protein